MRFWRKSETGVTASTVLVVSKEILSLLPFFINTKGIYGWMGNRMCRKVHVLPSRYLISFSIYFLPISVHLLNLFWQPFLQEIWFHWEILWCASWKSQRSAKTYWWGRMMDLHSNSIRTHKAVATYPTLIHPSEFQVQRNHHSSINPFFFLSVTLPTQRVSSYPTLCICIAIFVNEYKSSLPSRRVSFSTRDIPFCIQ